LAAIGEGADPQFRALEIGQYADWPAELGFHRPNGRHPLAHRLARRMAHIEAEDINAGAEQLRHDRGIFGSRTERCDDLDATQPPHFETAPCCVVF
jgi:hypothetical protein